MTNLNKILTIVLLFCLFLNQQPSRVFAAAGPENDFSIPSTTAFGQTAMRIGHAQYSFATDGGAQTTITPVNNFTLPTNATIIGASLNSTTAGVGATSSLSVGLSAGGGSTTSLVGATGVASWSLNAKVQATPVPQTASTWIKLTAPAQATVTITTANWTAGIIEVYVFYFVSST